MKITKPTLLIDEDKVRKNIKKFVAKTTKSKIRFRPHFKTHQSETIGNWFREYGVEAITVSSVDMAKYFVRAGWQDITIAFPVNILQIGDIDQLAQNSTLGVLIESVESASQLVKRITTPLLVWVEIDQGYNRTGVQKVKEILEIINTLQKSSHLQFIGLLTHAGHAYSAESVEELNKIHKTSIHDLKNKQRKLVELGYEKCQLSIGDTPTCSVTEDFTGVDEIRPGSFVFYDLDQLSLGACNEEELAMGVACPVVAKYPRRNEVIIFCGAVHLSKEYRIFSDGTKSFGKVSLFSLEGWMSPFGKTFVSSISQEHGIIQTTKQILESINIGDVLLIFPIHSCLTANLFAEYQTLTGFTIRKMQSIYQEKK